MNRAGRRERIFGASDQIEQLFRGASLLKRGCKPPKLGYHQPHIPVSKTGGRGWGNTGVHVLELLEDKA